MAKKSSKKPAKSAAKKPSAAQLAARAAFAARQKKGGKAKKKAYSPRASEPKTAGSKLRDDATSAYERAATVAVEVPKPAGFPEKSLPKSIGDAGSGNAVPFKRQLGVGTSFFV